MSARFAHGETSLVVGAVVACGLIGLGCALAQLGATPEEIAQARTRAESGANVFAAECAKCHGQRGEGIGSVPAILGPGALPEYPRSAVGANDPAQSDPQLLQIQAQSRPAGAAWRDPLRTAQDLFTFLTTHMPKGNVGGIKQADTWTLVNFMLAAQGAALPATGVGPANAPSVPIPRR
jgi:mono/diheme cytochrome c family protein